MPEWLVPLLSLLIAASGSLCSVIIANKLTTHKIKQFQETVKDIEQKNNNAHDVFFNKMKDVEKRTEANKIQYQNIDQTLKEIKQDLEE